jgi:hypothetical protein
MSKDPPPSAVYHLFARAMAERKQIVCTYDGYIRELCPVILGHTDGEEMALAYQFAGGSRSGLPEGGNWKCLRLSRVNEARLRSGDWRADSNHTRSQQCVRDVDLDVNPASPYSPKRRLPSKSRRR